MPGVTRDSHTGLPKAAVKRSLSVESSSTNSTNSSHMFSINNEGMNQIILSVGVYCIVR